MSSSSALPNLSASESAAPITTMSLLDPAVERQLEESLAAALNDTLKAAPSASSAKLLQAIATHLNQQADVLLQKETSSTKVPRSAILQGKTERRTYFDVDALLESVESGAIAPLKGRWLVQLHKDGGKLKRRQDLPPEAFITLDELRAIGHVPAAVSGVWSTSLPIIIIS